jgi:hypothetical protein
MDGLSEWAQSVTLEYMDQAQKENLEFAKSQNVEFVEIERAQLDRLNAASDSAFEEIAAGLEARGIPGNKVLAEARRLSKK